MQRASDISASILAEAQRTREALAAADGLTVSEHDRRRDAEQHEERERCAASVRAAAASTLERLTARLLPLRAQDVHAVRLGALNESEALQHVQTWLRGTGSALVLCGGVGTGKTIAAAWALREAQRAAMEQTLEATIDPCADHERAIERLRKTPAVVDAVPAALLARRVDPWKQDLAAGVEPLSLGVALLVVDDLGTERPDDARFAEAFFRVVDERQGAHTRTLITTNLKRADIRPRYGDRIADRLNHIGRAVEIKGASMRRKGEL